MHEYVTYLDGILQRKKRGYEERYWFDFVLFFGAALKWNYGPEENFPSYSADTLLLNMALTSGSVMFFLHSKKV